MVNIDSLILYRTVYWVFKKLIPSSPACCYLNKMTWDFCDSTKHSYTDVSPKHMKTVRPLPHQLLERVYCCSMSIGSLNWCSIFFFQHCIAGLAGPFLLDANKRGSLLRFNAKVRSILHSASKMSSPFFCCRRWQQWSSHAPWRWQQWSSIGLNLLLMPPQNSYKFHDIPVIHSCTMSPKTCRPTHALKNNTQYFTSWLNLHVTG